jgi:hypothetical protein
MVAGVFLWWPKKLQLPSKKNVSCDLMFLLSVVAGKVVVSIEKKNVSGDLMFLLLKSDCVALY